MYQLHISIRNMSHLVSFSDQKLLTLLLPCLKSFIRNTLMHILFSYAIGPLIIMKKSFLFLCVAFIGDIWPRSSSLGGGGTSNRPKKKTSPFFILVKYGALWDSLNEQREGVTHGRMGILKPTTSQITHSNRVLTHGRAIPQADEQLAGFADSYISSHYCF